MKSRSVILYNRADVVSFVLARNVVEMSDTLPVKPGLSLTDAARLIEIAVQYKWKGRDVGVVPNSESH